MSVFKRERFVEFHLIYLHILDMITLIPSMDQPGLASHLTSVINPIL